jgi:hypothetical protein
MRLIPSTDMRIIVVGATGTIVAVIESEVSGVWDSGAR